MLRVRREVFRRVALSGSGQHKVEADRTAQGLRIAIGQHTVLKLRRKEHQQPGLGGQIPVILIEGMVFANGTAMTDGETRHQLIGP